MKYVFYFKISCTGVTDLMYRGHRSGVQGPQRELHVWHTHTHTHTHTTLHYTQICTHNDTSLAADSHQPDTHNHAPHCKTITTDTKTTRTTGAIHTFYARPILSTSEVNLTKIKVLFYAMSVLRLDHPLYMRWVSCFDKHNPLVHWPNDWQTWTQTKILVKVCACMSWFACIWMFCSVWSRTKSPGYWWWWWWCVCERVCVSVWLLTLSLLLTLTLTLTVLIFE